MAKDALRRKTIIIHIIFANGILGIILNLVSFINIRRTSCIQGVPEAIDKTKASSRVVTGNHYFVAMNQ